LGLLVAISTLFVLGWLRLSHSAVSGQPSNAEQTINFAAWLLAIAIYFVVIPAKIAKLSDNPIKDAWPVHELVLFSAIVLVLAEFNFSCALCKSFPADLASILVCYILTTLSYVVGLARIFSTWKARSWRRFATTCLMAAVSGAAVLIIIWAVLFFE
jgi:uncharacterized membrane protein YeaQ/YmgE (transglycosylase-associated protein family)